MTNYTKTTNFATKDTLPSGNANKIVKGTEIDTEFNNIATAVATKADTAGPTFTGTVTIPTVDLNGGAIDGTTVGASTAAAITGTTIVANTSINIAGDGATVTGIKDEDDMSSNSATKLATQQSIKAYVDSQVTAQDLDFQADTGGALSIDLDSETLTFTGGTGVDTSGSGNAVTFAIDSTVATLTGSQTLSNKTLSTPVVSGNLTTDGLIDGRDVATDGTKLDGIEASADVTDTANVTAAGALMDSELTDIAAVKALNQGVATTDSPTFAGLTTTKLSTTSTGIDVTGTVTADGGTIDGALSVNTAGNLLTLNATSGVAYQAFKENGTNRFFLGTLNGSDGLAFIDADGASQRMVIDSSGNVGIGTSSITNNSNRTTLALQGAWGGQIDIMVGSTVHSQFGTDNFDSGQSCRIQSQDGIVFKTGGSTERMRIDSSGSLLVGTTVPIDGATKLSINAASNGSYSAPLVSFGGGVGYGLITWLDNVAAHIGQTSAIRSLRMFSGSGSAGVNLANAATSWGTFSDERLKENIEPIENALDSLSVLRTVKYHLKDVDGSGDKKKLGLIAQDLVGVLDEIIDPIKRQDDETEYMSVRYTEIIPVLVKAIQEQQATITALEARITQLENN